MLTYRGKIFLKDLLIKINNMATQKFGAQYSETRAQKLYKTSLTLKKNGWKQLSRVLIAE